MTLLCYSEHSFITIIIQAFVDLNCQDLKNPYSFCRLYYVSSPFAPRTTDELSCRSIMKIIEKNKDQSPALSISSRNFMETSLHK